MTSNIKSAFLGEGFVSCLTKVSLEENLTSFETPWAF